jgi:hypothetical protein
METNENNPGDTKWNNLQKKPHQNEELNEGFCADNIPDDYNPAEENIEDRLRTEFEVDQNGQDTEVYRARFVDGNSPQGARVENLNADNKIIEKGDSPVNRDRNYDIEPNRYPPGHPDNYENRGNLDTENP